MDSFGLSESLMNETYPTPMCKFDNDESTGSWVGCKTFTIAPDSLIYGRSDPVPEVDTFFLLESCLFNPLD